MWLTTERARNRLAAEKSLFSAAIDGDIPLCLIYPNEYAVGMSNLGFQAAYKIFTQHERCRCERAFLPAPDEAAALRRTGAPLASLETQRPLADFEILAFSISFETDYLHILDILAPRIFRSGPRNGLRTIPWSLPVGRQPFSTPNLLPILLICS